MKRAFAIIIVVLLGFGMVGMVFPALMQQTTTVAPVANTPSVTPSSVTYTSVPVTGGATTTTTLK